MDICCPVCNVSFHIDQPYQYHAGFGNQGFLYCDSCPNLVVFGSYDPEYVKIIQSKHPWTLNEAEKERVESRLRHCSCGGRFRFTAAPRCPLCNAPIPSILRDFIHYVETGRRFDSEKESIWTSPA